MKFTVSSTALNARLSELAKVISGKASILILDSFLFDLKGNQLIVTASDGENAIVADMEITDSAADGSFCVPAAPMLGYIKEIPEQPITFEIDMASYNVKGTYQNGEFTFVAQNAEEYPVLQGVEGELTTITLPASLLVRNISRSLFATAVDELRPVMNGLLFDQTPDGLMVVASDGHKLVLNTNKEYATETPSQFILPKKPATLLKAMLPNDDEPVSISYNQRNAEVKLPHATLTCRLIDGRFPRYSSVIPKDNPNILTIDRNTLLGALRRVLPFANESTALIRLRVEMGKLTLSSDNVEFASFGREELVCDYDGQPMTIGFKGSSLAESLTNLTCDEVSFKLGDPSRAGILEPAHQEDNEQVLMLVMPMLLND